MLIKSYVLLGTLQPTEMENFCPSDTAGSGTLVLSTTAPCGRTSASVTPATDSFFAQEKLPSQSSAQLSGLLQYLNQSVISLLKLQYIDSILCLKK